MLVLTRKEGDSLLIVTPDNKTISVKLVKCRNRKMEVGVDAPDDYLIVREEATIKQDND